jgi:hypothetical protein
MKIASLELLYPLTQIDFGGEKYESNRYTSEKLYNIFIILSIKHAANIAWLEAAETRSADEKRRERERGREGGRRESNIYTSSRVVLKGVDFDFQWQRPCGIEKDFWTCV